MYYFLFLLPLVVAKLPEHEGITLTINLATTESETNINTQGDDIKLLTDSEVALFNLTEENLEKAVEAHTGQKPQDVFINGPTPWNDLYKSYDWSEVKREFKLKNKKVKNVTADEIEKVVETYKNNETESKHFDGRSYKPYSTFFAKHEWSGSGVSARVRYEIFRPAKSSFDHSYESKVGQDSFSSGITAITYVEVAARFNLNSGQTANFIVTASKVRTNVQVDYETNLIGDVVVNYSNKYKDHHFWAFDVKELLPLLNTSGILKYNELVTLEYLSNIKVKVVDADTGKEIPFTVITNTSPV